MSVRGAEMIDGDFACHISGGAIDLGRVFAGKTTTADRNTWAVVIDDEFAAGEASVGGEAALLPVAGGVKMKFDTGRGRNWRKLVLGDETTN